MYFRSMCDRSQVMDWYEPMSVWGRYQRLFVCVSVTVRTYFSIPVCIYVSMYKCGHVFIDSRPPLCVHV